MKNLDLLIPQSQPTTDRFTWATVAETDPFLVRLDGDTAALDITPDCLVDVSGLEVGRRVWCQVYGRRVLVLGAAFGVARELVGTVKMFAGDTAPENYLLADGGVFSSNDYPDLAALIGTKFGGNVGDLYRLPDLRGRIVVGLDATQTEFDTIGETGGEKDHTLTVTEMPSHNHGGTTGGSYVEAEMGLNLASTNPAGSGRVARAGTTTTGVRIVSDSTHTHTIPSQGGGAAHNNLQPYVVMNYIICAR